MTPGHRDRLPLLVLVLLTGIGPLGLDPYLPSLPRMATELDATDAAMQFSVTLYVCGLAAGQVLLGPISDSIGRRKPLVWSAIAFSVSAGLSAVVLTSAQLNCLRAIQGVSAGWLVASGRAVVGDVYQGTDAAAKFGMIGSINLLGPVLSPLVGATILTWGGWRWIFVTMSILGVFAGASAWIFVGGGASHPLGAARNSVGVLERAQELFRLRDFRETVVVSSLTNAGFFAYLGAAPFAFASTYSITTGQYSFIFAGNAASMAIGALTFRFLVRGRSAESLRAWGVSATVCGTSSLVISSVLLAPPPLPITLGLLATVTFGMGLIAPASTFLAQQPVPAYRGTAASLHGGISFIAGATTTPALGLLSTRSSTVLFLTMFTAMLLALLYASRGWNPQRCPHKPA